PTTGARTTSSRSPPDCRPAGTAASRRRWNRALAARRAGGRRAIRPAASGARGETSARSRRGLLVRERELRERRELEAAVRDPLEQLLPRRAARFGQEGGSEHDAMPQDR